MNICKIANSDNSILDIIIKENNLNITSEEDERMYFPDLFEGSGDILSLLSPLNKEDLFVEKIMSYDKDTKICVLGDSDCDGIMGTVIMVYTLKSMGFETYFSIPNRITESYGDHTESVIKMCEKGVKVFITVDNGISSSDLKKICNDYNAELIVTDHHVPGENIPEETLIIDPKFNGDSFSDICGATVALKLSIALFRYKGITFPLSKLLPLAGIATVADMMPPLCENRFIIKETLQLINYCKYYKYDDLQFLKTLLINLGGYNFLFQKENALANENLISYNIAPTINAISVIKGDVSEFVNEILDSLIFNVFMTSKLGYKNQRKKIVSKLYESIDTEKLNNSSENIIMELFNIDDYEASVKCLSGSLANRLSNEYSKTVIVGVYKKIDEENYEINMSARSTENFDILSSVRHIILKYPELNIKGGGHSHAMGIHFVSSDLKVCNIIKNELEEEYNKSSEIVKNNAYIFEKSREEEIINGVLRYAPYGKGLKQIVFQYSGELISYDSKTKDAVIGDYIFKALTLDSNLIGKDVNVYFNILLDNSEYSTFLCVEIEEKCQH